MLPDSKVFILNCFISFLGLSTSQVRICFHENSDQCVTVCDPLRRRGQAGQFVVLICPFCPETSRWLPFQPLFIDLVISTTFKELPFSIFWRKGEGKKRFTTFNWHNKYWKTKELIRLQLFKVCLFKFLFSFFKFVSKRNLITGQSRGILLFMQISLSTKPRNLLPVSGVV